MQFGGLDGEVNEVVEIDDLSVATIIALIDRLKQTETTDQFVCREIELDAALLQSEVDIRTARSRPDAAAALEQLDVVRQHVLRAHDLVGESNLRAAIDQLNSIVEMKIGL